MKNKIIICLITIMLLTGCTANYNVTINKDLTVEENFEVIGDDRFKLTSGYTEDSMYSALKETYSELITEGDLDDIKTKIVNNNLTITSNIKYNNLNDFANSKYIKKIYKDGLKVSTDRSVVSITSINELDNFWLFVNGMEEDPLINKLKVSIKIPYEVISNNATSVDKKTNTFTWEYDFQDYDKSIEITFDKNKEFIYGVDTKKVTKYIVYIILLGLVIFAIYKVYKNKNKKNNKI